MDLAYCRFRLKRFCFQLFKNGRNEFLSGIEEKQYSVKVLDV